MPLRKRKPFALLKPPEDLKPDVIVYKIPFTEEIILDHQEYLNRLNLYNQSVWTCEVTGKTKLTYEEALKSEKVAREKVQHFPEELMAPVLSKIQFSTLSLTDLVESMYKMLQEQFFEGSEVEGKREQSVEACKILKIIKDENCIKYKVGWLDKDKFVTETAELLPEDLILKKAPCSRGLLKAFINMSTSQNHPWLIHGNLAKKYGIPEEIPHGLTDISEEGRKGNKKRKGIDNGDMNSSKRTKYPIDDLLVLPDRTFPIRPVLCNDFKVPIECAGNLIMVWDFCTTFSKLLSLSRFSLEDFESAICHKDNSNIVLIVESHAAILRLLIKEEGDYFFVVQDKKAKQKITLVNWMDFLCDFLEMEGRERFSNYLKTVRKGHYSLLDVNVKLDIYQELINEAVNSNAVRRRIGECVEGQKLIRKEYYRKNQKYKLAAKEATDIQNGSKTGNRHSESSKMESMDNHTEENPRDNVEKELDKLSVKTNPLGMDRNYNRYWFFKHERRLFIETSEGNAFGYYRTKEEFDALISSLNPKGMRERALKKQLEKNYYRIRNALQQEPKVDGRNDLSDEGQLRRSARKRTPTRSKPAFLSYVNLLKED